MSKMAYVSVTYLFSFEPENFNLTKDCSEEEFYTKTSEHMEQALELVRQQTGLNYNDIEITII